jgi:hypothetical protein
MKHLLSILLICSITLSQELTVEGDLNVTGNIQSADSLNQRIIDLELIILQLQTQIALLESQMIFLGQDLNNADCFGIVGGGAVLDECGVCDNDSSNDCLQDCFGEWGGIAEYDICGDCGGDATSEDDCSNYALDVASPPQSPHISYSAIPPHSPKQSCKQSLDESLSQVPHSSKTAPPPTIPKQSALFKSCPKNIICDSSSAICVCNCKIISSRSIIL